MNPVVAEVARHKAQAIAAAEDGLALSTMAALEYLGEAPKNGWQHFANWCGARNVRYLPASPATVAAYVLDMHTVGVKFTAIIDALEAIVSLHDKIGNPVATAIVGVALDRVADKTICAPRAWKAEEKANFYLLPTWTQAVLARREYERDKAIRNRQNAIAEESRKATPNECKTDKDAKHAA